MDFNNVMANLSVGDLDRARRWYAGLIGREPDARPMDGLLSWSFEAAHGSGLQIFLEPDRAGGGGVVLDLDDLTAATSRLDAAGIRHGEPVDATYSQVLQLADPDGNRVVLTAPFPRG